MNAMQPPKDVPREQLSQKDRAPVRGQEAARLPEPGGWLRFEQGLLNREQALRNLEQIVSLLQTAQAGLEKYDTTLAELTTALSTAWSHREEEAAPRAELREYVRRQVARLDEIARGVRFHGRGLLDGQSGVVGLGEGVSFIRGGPNTMTAPPEGYDVRISAFPARAAITGGVAVSEDWIWAEREIFLAEGDRFARYRPKAGESVQDFLHDLQSAVRRSGLDLDIGMSRQRKLIVRHTQYGSQFRFKGSSTTTPLLSKRPGKLEWSQKGRDIQGTLAGEPAFGIGRMLVGFLDNPVTSELAVSWKGELPGQQDGFRCRPVQNGIAFQEGLTPEAGQLTISVPSFLPDQLVRWVDTRTGFESLAQVRAENWSEVLDALYLLLAASGEVLEWNDRMRAWIERYRNRALSALRQGLVIPEAPPVSAEPPGGRAQRMAELLRRTIHGEPEAELPPVREQSG